MSLNKDGLMDKGELRFPASVSKNGFIPYNLGRIGVGSQKEYLAIRFFLTDEGLNLSIPKSAIDKGFVKIWDDTINTQVLGATFEE